VAHDAGSEALGRGFAAAPDSLLSALCCRQRQDLLSRLPISDNTNIKQLSCKTVKNYKLLTLHNLFNDLSIKF